MISQITNSESKKPRSYHGGKGLLYQRLISLIPPHDTYITAFAGHDAIGRMKRPARVSIAIDLDGEALEKLRYSIAKNGVLDQHAINDDAFRNPSPEIASAAPIVTSDGVVQPGSLVTNGEATRLDSWQFLSTDALAWLVAHDWRGDEFVYADPPYLMHTRRQKRNVYRYEMTIAQHRRLLSILVTLPCNVMVSGYHSQIYTDALRGWHTATFETVTRGGSPATEWVWMNYPAPVALHDYRYLGDGFRERERIKRKKRRWVERLRRMDTLERQALLAAIEEANL